MPFVPIKLFFLQLDFMQILNVSHFCFFCHDRISLTATSVAPNSKSVKSRPKGIDGILVGVQSQQKIQ